MAVPKSRHTKSKRDRRRAHIFLKEKILTACENCGVKILTHRACSECGYYKGRKVLDIAEKEKKKKAGVAEEKSGPFKGI